MSKRRKIGDYVFEKNTSGSYRGPQELVIVNAPENENPGSCSLRCGDPGCLSWPVLYYVMGDRPSVGAFNLSEVPDGGLRRMYGSGWNSYRIP